MYTRYPLKFLFHSCYVLNQCRYYWLLNNHLQLTLNKTNQFYLTRPRSPSPRSQQSWNISVLDLFREFKALSQRMKSHHYVDPYVARIKWWEIVHRIVKRKISNVRIFKKLIFYISCWNTFVQKHFSTFASSQVLSSQ